MALVFDNAVRETDASSTPATDPFTLDGTSVVSGHQGFDAASIADTDTVYYEAQQIDSGGAVLHREVGIGTWNDTAKTLTRSPIWSTAGASTKASFTSNPQVMVSVAAEAFTGFSQDKAGFVPGPTSAEVAADKVLRADGTWVTAGGSGAFTADGDTLITATTPIVLGHASNNEVALSLAYTVNKAAGNDTGLLISMTDTLSPGTSLPLDVQVDGTSVFTVNDVGFVAGGAELVAGFIAQVRGNMLVGNDTRIMEFGVSAFYNSGQFGTRTNHDLQLRTNDTNRVTIGAAGGLSVDSGNDLTVVSGTTTLTGPDTSQTPLTVDTPASFTGNIVDVKLNTSTVFAVLEDGIKVISSSGTGNLIEVERSAGNDLMTLSNSDYAARLTLRGTDGRSGWIACGPSTGLDTSREISLLDGTTSSNVSFYNAAKTIRYARYGIYGFSVGPGVGTTVDIGILRHDVNVFAIVSGFATTAAVPTATTVVAEGGSGTDIAGAPLKVAGGQGTGTGVGGNFVIQYAAAGTTGTSLNALADAVTVDGGTGQVTHSPILSAATGNEVAHTIAYTVNKATSGNDTGLLISMTDTASPGTSLPLDVQVGGSSIFRMTEAGNTIATRINAGGGDVFTAYAGATPGVNIHADTNNRGGAVDVYTTAGSLVSRIAGSVATYFNAGLGVGIGNNSPTTALDVTGDVLITGPDTSTTPLTVDTPAGFSGNVVDVKFNGTSVASIDETARVLLGTDTNRAIGGSNRQFLMEGTASYRASLSLVGNSADIYGSTIYLAKTRSATVGGNTIVADGDQMGAIAWAAADGADLTSVPALIRCTIDGTPGLNDTPGKLEFATAQDGSAVPTVALTIDSSQAAHFANVVTLFGISDSVNTEFGSRQQAISIDTDSTNGYGLSVARVSQSASSAPLITFVRSRVTGAVSNGDELGGFFCYPESSTTNPLSARMDFLADGVPGAGTVPTSFRVQTGTQYSTLVTGLLIDSSQNVSVPSGTFTVTGPDTSTTPLTVDTPASFVGNVVDIQVNSSSVLTVDELGQMVLGVGGASGTVLNINGDASTDQVLVYLDGNNDNTGARIIHRSGTLYEIAGANSTSTALQWESNGIGFFTHLIRFGTSEQDPQTAVTTGLAAVAGLTNTLALTTGYVALDATPAASTFVAECGSGTDIAGAKLQVAGGVGTGTGVGGDFVIQYAAAGGSGSSLNALADAVTVDGGTGGLRSVTATGGLGYGTGAGGAVTQTTTRTTGVTLNNVCGSITLVSAAGSATPASFTVTNSAVAATDVIVLSQKSGTDKYNLKVTAVAAGSFEVTFHTDGGTTTETPVFNFAVIKAVVS